MKIARLAAVLCAACTLPGCAAQADEDIRQELATEILEIQMDDEVLIDVADVIAAPMVEAYTPSKPDLTAELKSKIHIQLRDLFLAIVPQLRTPMEQFMAEHYTEHELHELLAFYRSDVGLKSLELAPQLMQVQMTTIQSVVTEEMPRITEVIGSVLQQAREQSNP